MPNLVALYGGQNLKDKDYVTTTFNHFYGNRSSNLYNQMQLECKDVKDKTNMYLNTELVVDSYPVKDDKGNVIANLPIAVASGNVHVTQDGGTMNSILNQLPEDLLQHGDITVRSYPWRGQAEVCWYGHMVETTVTPAQMSNYINACETGKGDELLDSSRNNARVFGQKDKDVVLNDGYVICLDENGNYNILYSAFLHYSETYNKQIDEKIYQVKDGTVTSSGYTVNSQPAPVINPNLVISEDSTQYTFTWDEGKSYSNAGYDVQLTAIADDGSTIVLGSAAVTGQNQYTFINESNNWDYTDYTLTVTRIGTTDSSGKTTAFAAKSIQNYKVKQRFAQIARPTVSLHRDENGEVNKDSLLYDITWRIATIAERDSGEISQFEVKIAYTDGNGKEQEKKQLFDLPNPIPEGTNPNQQEILDLNEFAPGQTLRISVRALAKEDAVTYRDGVEGVIREITLPVRQSVPDITTIISDAIYQEDQFVTETDWEKGFEIAVNNNAITEVGKYEIAVAVYDEKTESGDDTVAAGDAPDAETAGYWDSGALATLISKASRTVMEGNLTASTYQLVTGLKSDYAGKWLKIALRSISESNISSSWTDEDAAGMSVNYAWIQLPRLQIDAVDITRGETTVYYDAETGEWGFKDLGVSDMAVVRQTALDLTLSDRADMYQIAIVPKTEENSGNTGTGEGNTQPEEKETVGTPESDMLYIEAADKAGAEYNVFYLTAEAKNAEGTPDNADPGNQENIPVSKQEPKAVFIATVNLQAEGVLQLPVTKEIRQAGKLTGISTVMALSWEKAKEEEAMLLQLILPDAESITQKDDTQTADEENQPTGRVRAQALIEEEDKKWFEDSEISEWKK